MDNVKSKIALVERCRGFLDFPNREPEDWPVPMSKADVRELLRVYQAHERIVDLSFVGHRYNVGTDRTDFPVSKQLSVKY